MCVEGFVVNDGCCGWYCVCDCVMGDVFVVKIEMLCFVEVSEVIVC